MIPRVALVGSFQHSALFVPPAAAAGSVRAPWPAWSPPKSAPACPIVPADIPANTPLDDLLLATAAGDRRAFEQLYQRSSPALYAAVRRSVWLRCEAEEVLQEAYVKIWRHAGSFDPRQAQASTWMARIVRNHAIDHLRRGNARATHEVARDTDLDGDSTFGGADQLADAAPTPLQLLEQHEQVRRVDSLLACLSASQRQVLVLAFREGLSQAEIAARLGAPLGTVKSWMRRGLLGLKELLGNDGAHPAHC